MKIHEYQGKELFRKFGVATPRGIPCFTVDEALAAAKKLGGGVWVVKAQIHAGGRGKGGGVKLAKSLPEVKTLAQKILGMNLVTHQTGPGGQKVRRLLIEEGADIRKELYVGMVVDRVTQRVALMASSEGGMDIEEVAAHAPEKIHKVFIDPVAGLSEQDAGEVALRIGVPESMKAQAVKMLQGLYQCFWETDASLAEINPLILTGDGRVVALDAKPDLNELLTVSDEDIDNLKGTRSRLKVGAQLSREEMLRLALMASENRASSALSRHYPGGREAFIAAMNRKAQALGLADTRFEDATGLTAANVSSPRDLAKLVDAAHRYPLIREFSTAVDGEFNVAGRAQQFRNTNTLVSSPTWEIGLSKTGYISEAGKCLVMQAWLNNKPTIIVLLDSWGRLTRIGDANHIKRWIESASLNRTSAG